MKKKPSGSVKKGKDKGKGSRDSWVTGRPIKGLTTRLFENHCLSSFHLETYEGAESVAAEIELKRKELKGLLSAKRKFEHLSPNQPSKKVKIQKTLPHTSTK